MNLFFIFCLWPYQVLHAQTISSATTASVSVEQPIPKGEEKKPSSLLESLSVSEPPGLAGQFPSARRFKAPLKWRADGWILEKKASKIKETGEFQLMSPPGAKIEARLRKGVHVSVNDRLTVYRVASRHEKDLDVRARYLFKIGTAKVVKIMGKSLCQIKIETANDAVEGGDLIKKDW